MFRTLAYYFALAPLTIWYAGRCVLAWLLRVPWTRGGVYDRMQRHWARRVLGVAGVRVALEGAGHLPLGEARIVSANHASFFDILALLGYLPVDAKFIAKKEIFAIPILGQAMHAAGHVAMDRGHQKQAFGAYDRAAAEMRAKNLAIVVYPEGTRTRSGELLPFKKGAFVFAIASGAPIVPCWVEGAFRVNHKGDWRIRPGTIRLTLGPPIATRGLSVDDRDALADRTRQAMLALAAR